MQINVVPRPPGFAHVLVHADDPAELVARVAPPAAAAVGATGAQIVVAVSEPAEKALREEFADLPGAPGIQRLTTLTRSARASAQTVAAWRARELRALSAERPVVVITQHDPELDGVDGGFWIELEAALNISLDGLPVTQFCVYPRLPLHGAVGEGALANHPLRLHGDQLVTNPAHRSPAEVLAALPFAPPHLLGPPDLCLQYNTFELGRVRDVVEGAARASGLEPARGEDMVQAVNEVATNAVEHGSPEAGLSVWARPGELVCEIQDSGSIALPLIGLAPPHPSQQRGRGAWIARQLCDSLHVWRAPDGTHVRLLTSS
ncbi:ATP-binding protein [Pseudonocardia sp. C8]|uniref:ATP-binding protein n=1 Tax=Pseudonocardia sp. C8 TaxID=2762759 RepID=UPI0016430FE0|nr:ATP-binding protein [Pseudonocardia sp. C8]MBC3191977.1 ATP-binding protein [Pseudonocardia sp. C8]